MRRRHYLSPACLSPPGPCGEQSLPPPVPQPVLTTGLLSLCLWVSVLDVSHRQNHLTRKLVSLSLAAVRVPCFRDLWQVCQSFVPRAFLRLNTVPLRGWTTPHCSVHRAMEVHGDKQSCSREVARSRCALIRTHILCSYPSFLRQAMLLSSLAFGYFR